MVHLAVDRSGSRVWSQVQVWIWHLFFQLVVHTKHLHIPQQYHQLHRIVKITWDAGGRYLAQSQAHRNTLDKSRSRLTPVNSCSSPKQEGSLFWKLWSIASMCILVTTYCIMGPALKEPNRIWWHLTQSAAPSLLQSAFSKHFHRYDPTTNCSPWWAYKVNRHPQSHISVTWDLIGGSTSFGETVTMRTPMKLLYWGISRWERSPEGFRAMGAAWWSQTRLEPRIWKGQLLGQGHVLGKPVTLSAPQFPHL